MSKQHARALMTHVVAGYPSKEECIELIVGMDKLGVSDIEIQIPFSDPSADGPTIMEANDVVLKQGMTTMQSFELIAKLQKKGVRARLHVMTYANKLQYMGYDQFCKSAAAAGVSGFIIPDLALGTNDYDDFLSECHHYGLQFIPVVSPGIDGERLTKLVKNAHGLVYVTSRHGITGTELALDQRLQATIAAVRNSNKNATIALGFGIQTPEDVTEALKIADCAVVGSAVILETKRGGVVAGLQLVEAMINGDTL